MTVTLARACSGSDAFLFPSASFGLPPTTTNIPITIDSEKLLLVTGASGNVWGVLRGQSGSGASAHAVDAAITIGWAGGGGSISATDGTTTVDPATSLVFTTGSVSDGGDGAASVSALVISDDDPGAVGAGRLWLQTGINGNFVQLNVRDDADTFWVNITPVFYETAGAQAIDSPDGASEVSLGASALQSNFTSDTAISVRVYGGGPAELKLDTTGMGFFGHAPAARPTGVAVTAAAIHAALVSLGLITA